MIQDEAMVTRLAAGCAAIGGLLFAAFLLAEAPQSADFADLTFNLGLAAFAIAALETIGLLRDWRLAWAAAIPIGLWLVFVGLAPLLFDEFAGAPMGGLIGLAGLALIGCVLLRLGEALSHRGGSDTGASRGGLVGPR